ncbi:hypothetical protein GQ44DRAFT_669581 [Phaeosphaeriaceae sp. PMI808]|nr:hypothetical protein GQ44DRAFT_669581 [Phaeosphaeriaceae sp. PMI808]
MCLGLNNQPVSPYGEKVKAITLLSPTIFPIIYAAILGKMLRRIGLFKAERGTTVGDLERLIGCQSIFSTFERQISLRRFDMLGIAILLSWLLFPVGGQASLRLLSTKPYIINYNTTIQYYPIEFYPKASYLRSSETAQEKWSLFAPLYMTAIQTSRQSLYTPMDFYGDVKIPDINRITKEYVAIADTNYRWYPIGNDTMLNYTSILGIPTIGTAERRNCSFGLISHYWEVNCKSMDNGISLLWQSIFPANTTKIEAKSPTFQIRVDKSQSSFGHIKFEYLSRQTESIAPNRTFSATCNASPRVVESQVKCHDGSCAVRAIRRVDRKPVDVWGEISPLSAFLNISQWMPGADLGSTQGIISTSELIEHWIMDPYLTTIDEPFVRLDIMDPQTFNHRLQIAINTFWDASIGMIPRASNLRARGNALAWNRTDAEVTEYKGEVYSCSIALAVLTIAISLSLFVAANVSTLLGILTRTPDILGFVSVSARDNPYFKRHVTSYLSGLETARALRDVRVRVGDVKSEEKVGHIALATLDARPKKLSWTRKYD